MGQTINSKRFWSVVSDIVGNKTKSVVSNLQIKFDSIDTLVNEINNNNNNNKSFILYTENELLL